MTDTIQLETIQELIAERRTELKEQYFSLPQSLGIKPNMEDLEMLDQELILILSRIVEQIRKPRIIFDKNLKRISL